MADNIRVNNNQYGWASIVAKIDGDTYYGLTSISFADKRERVKAYGMGRHHAPRGRSPGKYSVDAVKVVGWKSSIQTLLADLAKKAPDGKSYGNVEFEIVVQYIESDETPISVVIERCVITSVSSANEESADPLKEELEIDAMLIRRNDLTLFDGTAGVGP